MDGLTSHFFIHFRHCFDFHHCTFLLFFLPVLPLANPWHISFIILIYWPLSRDMTFEDRFISLAVR